MIRLHALILLALVALVIALLVLRPKPLMVEAMRPTPAAMPHALRA